MFIARATRVNINVIGSCIEKEFVMRPDVKLGMAISLVVVLVAGGYYLYRDTRTEPIRLAGSRVAEADRGEGTKVGEVGTRPDQAVPRLPRAAKKSTSSRPKTRAKPKARPASVQETANASDSRSASARAKSKANAPSAGNDESETTALQAQTGENTRRPGEARRPRLGKRTTRQRREASLAPAASEGPKKLTRGNAAGPPGTAIKRRQPTARDRAAGKTKQRTAGPARRNTRADVTASRSSKGGPAAAPASSVRADPAVETHLVQSGDTFSSLAMAYYGHEKYTQLLIDGNPQIEDPRRLRIGSRIKIPPVRPSETPSVSKRATHQAALADRDTAGRRTYRVRPGDSFYAIARTVLADASRWEEVFTLNRELVGGDPKKLQVGQVLILPDP